MITAPLPVIITSFRLLATDGQVGNVYVDECFFPCCLIEMRVPAFAWAGTCERLGAMQLAFVAVRVQKNHKKLQSI
jgi:hypothetical protein